MFEGFSIETISFFASIAVNNNKVFFDENRHVYERFVKQPLYSLCEALTPVVRSIDPLFDVRPARCVSRIHRDIRFSRDKSPFRDYMWVGFRRVGESNEDTCGFYFDVSATNAHWGCGYYHAQKETMQNLRDTILDKPAFVLSIVEDERLRSSFALMGERYVKKFIPPSCIPEPLAALYQMKNVYAEHSIDNMNTLCSKDLLDQITDGFQTLSAFYALLRDCMIRKEGM